MTSKKSSIDKGIKVLIAFIAIVFVLSLGLLFYLITKESSALSGADKVISLATLGGFSCEYAEAQKLFPFEEGVLKITTDRIAYLTLSGNQVYGVSISYSNPSINVNKGRAVIFDEDGYSFTVVDKNGMVYQTPTSNQIKSCYISDNGLVSVISSDDDSYGVVNLYNDDGTLITEWTSYDSGYPISCAFNKNDSLFAITTLNTSGAMLTPYIRLFSLSDLNGSTKANYYGLYSIEEPDIFSSVFFSNERIYTFSSNRIYTVENDVCVRLSFECGAINQVNLVGSNLFIVYSDGVNQVNKLMIVDSNARNLYDSTIGSNLNATCSLDDNYAISIDNRIYVYNNDTVRNDISVDQDVLRMGFIDQNKLLVITTSGVRTIDL